MFNTLSNATNVTGRVLLSVALLVGSSSFAYGQVSESSYSLNGKTVNYIDNANESIEVISDNKLQSPDRKWSYIYDEQRRVISIEGPQLGDLDKTNIEYLDNGITKIITNPLGHKDIFEYDQDDRLISWIEPNGMKTTLSYGAKGSNPISFTSADGTTLSSKTELLYDNNGQVSKIILASGRILEVGNDQLGNPLSSARSIIDKMQKILASDSLRNLSGNLTSNGGRYLPKRLSPETLTMQSYDLSGRVINAIDEQGGITSYAYDENNNVTEIKDARGVTTSFIYNGFGEVISEFSSERGAIYYSYDSAGNIIKQVSEGGITHIRKYDLLNRVTKETVKRNANEKTVTHYYYDECRNGIGRLCKVVSDNHITKYEYNEHGDYRKIATKHSGESSFETSRYFYGSYGRLEKIKYPTGLTIRYGYSDDGYVNKVTGKYDFGDNKTEFVIAKNIRFDPLSSKLTSLKYGNGLKKNYSL